MNAKRVARWLAHRGADLIDLLNGYNDIQRLGIASYSRDKQIERMKQRQPYALSSSKEFFVVSTRDSVIGPILLHDGEYDFDKLVEAFDVMQFHGIAKPTVLVDIGANIGSICIPAVSRGLVGKAIAIEPGPENCRLLRANIELNDLRSKIEVHEVALGQRDDETLVLQLSPENNGDHQIAVKGSHSGRDTVEVASARLDTVLEEADAGSIFLWMDVQGYEGHVLAGAADILDRRPPMVLEFSPRGLRRTASFGILKESLEKYDYFVDLRQPKQVRPIAALDALYDQLGDDGDYDLVENFTDIFVFSR